VTQEAKPLTPKQQRFVDEYLVDLNATQAAIRAGYSPRTAYQQGHETLKKPEVAAAIQARREELSRATGITVERVLKEMAAIAFSDVRELFHEDGSMKAVHELPDSLAPGIASVEMVSYTPPSEDAVPEITKKVRLWDKPKALERLLEHLKGAEMEGRVRALEEKLEAATGADA